jgi:hypothetical protein
VGNSGVDFILFKRLDKGLRFRHCLNKANELKYFKSMPFVLFFLWQISFLKQNSTKVIYQKWYEIDNNLEQAEWGNRE